MRAVFGIGNIGSKYYNTRHNIGFSILDAYANKWKIKFTPFGNDYYFTGSKDKASHFILIKPSSYVNLSGLAAKQIVEKYDINNQDLLVVCDDLNLELGKIRLRKSGGDGGHNGLSSIIYHLQTDQFPRFRFGIGNEFQEGLMVNYVLEKFSEKEKIIIEPSISFAIDLIEKFIQGGIKEMLEFYSISSNQLKNPKIKEGN